MRGYQPDEEEIQQLYQENIKITQVIAGQPIQRGGNRCSDSCDTYNHHVHTYCKFCKRQLLFGQIQHECDWGFEVGNVHPGMNPMFVINVPWWTEPILVQQENLRAYIRFFERTLNNLPFYTQDITSEPKIVELD